MAKASKARVEANARWDAKAYDKMLLRVPKGRKTAIQAHAEAAGESLNGYVVGAVEARMEREGQPMEDTPATLQQGQETTEDE